MTKQTVYLNNIARKSGFRLLDCIISGSLPLNSPLLERSDDLSNNLYILYCKEKNHFLLTHETLSAQNEFRIFTPCGCKSIYLHCILYCKIFYSPNYVSNQIPWVGGPDCCTIVRNLGIGADWAVGAGGWGAVYGLWLTDTCIKSAYPTFPEKKKKENG